MKVRDSIRVAVRNLRLAKGRTALCVLAISIGICSVCVIRGLGSCATNLISYELGTIGVRGTTFYVDGPGSFYENALEHIGGVSQVTAASPFSIRSGYIAIRDRRFASAICGVNQQIADIFSLELLYGRKLTSTDLQEKARVIVLDAGTAERAYGRKNIVGKTINVTIGGVSDTFTVIGIVASQQSGLESLFGETLPSISYAPYTALNEMKMIQTTMIAVSFEKGTSESVRTQISEMLLENATDGTNVRFQNLDSYEQSFLSISDTIAWFATGVAAISALVAGIGVMNTMLSAVDARTHEIGVYMALGAQKKDLIRNFFLETCLTCFTGGLIGAGVYGGIFFFLQQIVGQMIQIEITQIILGIGVALCCGVVFGIIPAIKVSNKDPIEILKAD